MGFKILKKSKKSRARLGVIETPHGLLRTPAFFPVATQASVKTLDSRDIKEIGYEGILCNTYHLMLRPGSGLIKKLGGLHKFMNFPGVVVTDSGGFQVFSLGKGLESGVGKIAKIFPGAKKIAPLNKPSFVRVREEGVYFKSHLDGREYFLSPEKSIQIQKELAADIIFTLDECTSPLDGLEYTEKAMARTHRWALRCLEAAKRPISNVKSQNSKPKLKTKNQKKQMLFGIVQGGEYKKLRIKSAQFIGSLPFAGFGIGGSLGKTKKKMFEILNWVIPLLPEEKPRHLLGIGYLADLEESIKKGVDLFDCAYPTRFARHGVAITNQGIFDLKKSKFLRDVSALDKKCICSICQEYSRAYISHLFRAKEITALRLLTYHNLYFFKDFIYKIREKIEQGKI